MGSFDWAKRKWRDSSERRPKRNEWVKASKEPGYGLLSLELNLKPSNRVGKLSSFQLKHGDPSAGMDLRAFCVSTERQGSQGKHSCFHGRLEAAIRLCDRQICGRQRDSPKVSCSRWAHMLPVLGLSHVGSRLRAHAEFTLAPSGEPGVSRAHSP